MDKDEFLKEEIEELENNISEDIEVYTVEVTCENCGFTRYYHTIPKGTPWREWLKNEKCINCKCNIIKDDKRKY